MDNNLQQQQQATEATMAAQNQQLFELFWNNINQEIMQTADIKKHQLPLTRIKRVMKAVPDVHMVSAEAPALLSKACELVILDLTFRSWLNVQEKKHNTVKKDDILATIIKQDDLYQFLVGDSSGLSAGDGLSSATEGSGGHANNDHE